MTHRKEARTNQKERIMTLDLMRGYFIFMIIIDHLQRWPGFFDWFTGQGRLWASAAEGFIFISGLLIGLIRGHKDKQLPMPVVTKKILKRAFTLYVWAVLCAVISLLAVTYWKTSFNPFPPGLDSFSPNMNDYFEIATLQSTFGWSVFLMFYAAFLAVAPVVIYLLRKNLWWLVLILSTAVWGLGQFAQTMFFTWQLLFFIGAIVGYHYFTLVEKWHHFQYKTFVKVGVISAAALTVAASAFTLFAWPLVKSDWFFISYESFLRYRDAIDPFFTRTQLLPLHLVIALLWITAIYFIFHRFEHQIYKWFGWLLLQFGRHSLFVYILQGFVVILISGIFPPTRNHFINAAITGGAILILWGLTKVKILHKIIPS